MQVMKSQSLATGRLSRFRHINESLGQTVGDQLVAVANRLRSVVTGN